MDKTKDREDIENELFVVETKLKYKQRRSPEEYNSLVSREDKLIKELKTFKS